MKWAIIASLVLHLAILSLVFKTPRSGERKYPPVMIVRLASPPPLRGVQQPAVQQTSAPEAAKVQKKAEKPPEDTRTVDVSKKKKPRREQKPTPEPPKEETNRQTQESQSKGLPEGVDLGSEFGAARLDAAGFESPTYLNILFGKIRSNWDNPFEGGDSIKCTIYFAINRDGKIFDAAVESPSGIEAYDQSALRAILTTKAPPLPNQFELSELGIHLVFRYIPFE
jgi:TonB family protein